VTFEDLYKVRDSGDTALRRARSSPRVSVIIPTYNRERYLLESINSVLSQTLRDLELIVVDDGSTDSTAALVGTIADERVRYFVRPHSGLSASLNFGIGQARGEYLARLDSDDVLVPDGLAALAVVLDENRRVGVVWGWARWMTREGRDLPRTRGGPEHFPGDLLRSLLYDDCTCCTALLIRKVCFEQVGLFDEALGYSEDWDMAIRLACCVDFQFVDRAVVRVREHDESMTGKFSPQRADFLATRTAPLDKLFRDPDLPALVAAMKPLAYANVHIFCGRMWLSTRHFAAASREFARAIRVSGRPFATAVAIAWRVGVAQIVERSRAGRGALAALERLARNRRFNSRVVDTGRKVGG
jgi:glycosyltransferase involved in cell wall biosynthesis